jgi:hypothetical protein
MPSLFSETFFARSHKKARRRMTLATKDNKTQTSSLIHPQGMLTRTFQRSNNPCATVKGESIDAAPSPAEATPCTLYCLHCQDTASHLFSALID